MAGGRIKLGLLLAGLTVVGGALWVSSGAAQQLPPPPAGLRPAVTPTPPGQVRVPTADPTETQAQRLQRLRQAKPNGRVYDIAAETRGKPITIAGKTIALPPDAYVEAVVTNVTCGVGNPNPCPELPAYLIRRGSSRIGVAINSGRINAETLAPGEERTFDFLKTALRGA